MENSEEIPLPDQELLYFIDGHPEVTDDKVVAIADVLQEMSGLMRDFCDVDERDEYKELAKELIKNEEVEDSDNPLTANPLESNTYSDITTWATSDTLGADEDPGYFLVARKHVIGDLPSLSVKFFKVPLGVTANTSIIPEPLEIYFSKDLEKQPRHKIVHDLNDLTFEELSIFHGMLLKLRPTVTNHPNYKNRNILQKVYLNYPKLVDETLGKIMLESLESEPSEPNIYEIREDLERTLRQRFRDEKKIDKKEEFNELCLMYQEDEDKLLYLRAVGKNTRSSRDIELVKFEIVPVDDSNPDLRQSDPIEYYSKLKASGDSEDEELTPIEKNSERLLEAITYGAPIRFAVFNKMYSVQALGVNRIIQDRAKKKK